MHTPDAEATGAYGAGQIAPDIGRQPIAYGNQPISGIGRHFVQKLAIGIHYPLTVRQEDQLVGADRNSCRLRDFLHRQIEGLSGRAGAQWRKNDDVAKTKLRLDSFGVNFAHAAGVLHVDTIDHTEGLGYNKIAGHCTDRAVGHRRIRQALRKQRIDLQIDAANGIDHTIKRSGIGNAIARVRLRFQPLFAQLFLNLRPCAVYQNQTDAQRRQQVGIVSQASRERAGDGPTAESDDERLATEQVNVGRNRTKQRDKMGRTQFFSHVVFSPYPSLWISRNSMSFPNVRRWYAES